MGLEIEVGLACTHFHIQHTYIHIAMITPPCFYVGCDISHAAASKQPVPGIPAKEPSLCPCVYMCISKSK